MNIENMPGMPIIVPSLKSQSLTPAVSAPQPHTHADLRSTVPSPYPQAVLSPPLSSAPQSQPISLPSVYPTIMVSSKRKITEKMQRRHFFDSDRFFGNSIQEIIENEVKMIKFSSHLRQNQFRKTLTIISSNDYSAFMDDKKNFTSVFGSSYTNFQKKGVILAYRYCLLFGATNLFRVFRSRNFQFNESYIPVFCYLLETRPLNEVLTILSHLDGIHFCDESRIILEGCILAHHPDISPLKRVFLKLIGQIPEIEPIKYIISAPECQDSYDKLFLAFRETTFTSAKALCPIFKENVKYFNSTSDMNKFSILKAMILIDDLAGLQTLLLLAPKMAFYVHANSLFNLSQDPYSTLLLYASTQDNSLKCLDFLIQNYPELVTTSIETIGSPLFKILKTNFNVGAFKILSRHGFDINTIIKINWIDLNILQSAIYLNNFYAYEFYSNQVSEEEVIGMIRSFWPTDISILAFLMKNQNLKFIKAIVDLLKIDINGQFRYKDYEGNATIVLVADKILSSHFSFRYINLDMTQPIIYNNPHTGKKEIVLFA